MSRGRRSAGKECGDGPYMAVAAAVSLFQKEVIQ